MSDYKYQGRELEAFQHAKRWRAYFSSTIAPHIRGAVLEVEAGVGATTRLLCDGRQDCWVGLESDRRLAERLQASLAKSPLPIPSSVVVGTLGDLSSMDQFDTILYIDVLEHIQNDQQQTHRAVEHLRRAGKLIVLSPAHSWLFSNLDRAVGHRRRYSKAALRAIMPYDVREVRLIYLDSMGMLASAFNRLLLKSSRPTPRQVRFWDSALVRMSRWVDPLLGHRIGKAVLGIWEKR